MPAIIGKNGFETDVPIELNGDEAIKLKQSAEALKEITDSVKMVLV